MTMQLPKTASELKSANLTAYDCETNLYHDPNWDLKETSFEVLKALLEMVKEQIDELQIEHVKFHDRCPQWYDNYIFPMDCAKSKIEWAMEDWTWDDDNEIWVFNPEDE